MNRAWPLLLVAAVGLLSSLHALANEDCFRREDNRQLAFRIYQLAAPPQHTESSAYYPATDFAAASGALQSSPPLSADEPRLRRHHLLWANRCTVIEGVTPGPEACRNPTRTKGNIFPNIVAGPLGSQLRTLFSTYERADACTIISAMRLAGDGPGEIAAKAQSAGLTVVDKTSVDSLRNLARPVVTGMGKNRLEQTQLVDTCVIEREPMASDAAGIVLDYEVFDNRSPQQVLTLFRQLRDVLHRHHKTLAVTSNTLPRAPNGLVNSNAHQVLELVDSFIPFIATGASLGNEDMGFRKRERTTSLAENYKEQLAVLTDNGRAPLTANLRAKLVWGVSLYDTRLSEAAFMHQEIGRQGYNGIMLIRNYVKQGGACSRESNQLTACLAFGECSGTFGSGR